MINILFLGDITAQSGREAVIKQLPVLKKEYAADFVIANGENAAHGKGITSHIYKQLKDAGIDVITLGNHAFSKREVIASFSECKDMIRPLNMEPLDIGKAYIIKEVKGKKIAVLNVLGAAFMNVALENPVPVIERLLKNIKANIYILDIHAETTSEKKLCAYYFNDKFSAIIGTHTHVQTADEQIIDGCAFISDVGMCGCFESIIGRDKNEVIDNLVYGKKTRYVPAKGPAILCGVLIRIDEKTNRAISIERIQIRPEENV